MARVFTVPSHSVTHSLAGLHGPCDWFTFLYQDVTCSSEVQVEDVFKWKMGSSAHWRKLVLSWFCTGIRKACPKITDPQGDPLNQLVPVILQLAHRYPIRGPVVGWISYNQNQGR